MGLKRTMMVASGALSIFCIVLPNVSEVRLTQGKLIFWHTSSLDQSRMANQVAKGGSLTFHLPALGPPCTIGRTQTRSHNLPVIQAQASNLLVLRKHASGADQDHILPTAKYSNLATHACFQNFISAFWNLRSCSRIFSESASPIDEENYKLPWVYISYWTSHAT